MSTVICVFFLPNLKMHLGGSRLTFCKLKHLSGVLQCHFSRLRYCVSSKSIPVKSSSLQVKCPMFSISKMRYSSATSSQSPFTDVNIESIAQADEELIKKLKVIILEVEVMRQEGLRVPSVMTDSKWSELLALPTRSQRLKLLAFWWLNEKKKESTKQKKEKARLRRETSYSEEEKKDSDHIHYGFGGSTIFIRIYETMIDHFHNTALIRSMMFGQNLVIDCSYDQYMTPKEAGLCAKQLKILFADNRLNEDPFNIHFCNVNKEGEVFKKLHKLIPTMYDDAFPMNITEKSFLDLFPKRQLVYLTPHCREELKEYNYDDVYIVGAMVDKVNVDPLSLGKAKSLGLRMAKLPLDRYLDWGVGGKSLTIDQMILILLELKSSRDWRKALKYVPRRKLKNNFQQNNFPKFKRDMRFA